MTTPPVCILACSPRAQGNSDHMAELFAQGVRQGGQEHGIQAHIYALRDYSILPCTACGACFRHPQGLCQFSTKDDVAELFSHIIEAPHVFFAAPIFFYHVPAIAKAFMDRAQQLWAQRSKSTEKKTMQKKASVGLVAARSKGDNLFSGTLWSLHYFFDVFHREIEDKHLFTGHDGPKDFAQDALACSRIEKAGYAIGRQLAHKEKMSIQR